MSCMIQIAVIASDCKGLRSSEPVGNSPHMPRQVLRGAFSKCPHPGRGLVFKRHPCTTGCTRQRGFKNRHCRGDLPPQPAGQAAAGPQEANPQGHAHAARWNAAAASTPTEAQGFRTLPESAWARCSTAENGGAWQSLQPEHGNRGETQRAGRWVDQPL